MATASGAMQRFLFKQIGHADWLVCASWHQNRYAHFGRGGTLALPVVCALGVPLHVTFHGGDATKGHHQPPIDPNNLPAP